MTPLRSPDAHSSSRWQEYVLLMRLDRPVGIYLLLWPTLWALWFAAGGVPELNVLLVFVAGVVLMRSAGCVINDVADRHFDPHVERTRQRPIAAGRVSVTEAMTLFTVLCLLALALVLTMNRLTLLLAVPAVMLAASYPFAKRYTYLPQAHLGAAFGWSVPMAFAAQTGEVPQTAWLLFLATLLWAVAYDTFYAMVDREDDLKIGVKSTAILFGRFDRAITALLQLAVLLLLLWAGLRENLAAPYFIGIGVALGLAGHQQYRIRDRDPAQCFRAFLENNRFGAVIFIGLLLAGFY